jgi:hypothetical protein
MLEKAPQDSWRPFKQCLKLLAALWEYRKEYWRLCWQFLQGGGDILGNA